MKKVILLIKILVILFFYQNSEAQYFYIQDSTLGNPRDLYQLEDQDSYDTTSSGFSFIFNSNYNSPTYSSFQTIPFSFKMEGGAFNTYKISNTGVLTFFLNSPNVPGPNDTLLEFANLPLFSICAWGNVIDAQQYDGLLSKTIGNPPYRQHWISFFSASDLSVTSYNSAYYSIVLEESTNFIWFVYQWGNTDPNSGITVGVKSSPTNYIDLPGSPDFNIPGLSTIIDDNVKYVFVDSNYLNDRDVYMDSVYISRVLHITSNNKLRGKIQNIGLDTINSFVLNFKADNGPKTTDTISGLSIPFFEHYEYLSSSYFSPEFQSQELQVWVSNINGQSLQADNIDTIIVPITATYDQFTPETELYTDRKGLYNFKYGDFDMDGDMDFVCIRGSSNPRLFIYERVNEVKYRRVYVDKSSGKYKIDLQDLDNDGDLDISIRKVDSLIIYRNDANFTFTRLTKYLINENEHYNWGDIDNDGDKDLIYTGSSDYNAQFNSLMIFKNNGNLSFQNDNSLNYNYGPVWGYCSVGDVDNDNRLDILLAGKINNNLQTDILYNKTDSFNRTTAFTTNSVSGYTSLVDYDNDGVLDIFNNGFDTLSFINWLDYKCNLIKNSGSNNFININDTIIKPIYYNGQHTRQLCKWGDLNNDGLNDMIGSHMYYSAGYDKLFIYSNNGNNVFIEDEFLHIDDAGLLYYYNLLDYDGDGDLDIGFSAYSYSEPKIHIYKNNSTTVNNPPSVPANLVMDTLNSLISWDPSSDDHTPSVALTYNVSFGTVSNPNKFYSGHANLTTGAPYKFENGNIGFNSYFDFSNIQLNDDSTYVLNVQAIDNAYNRSNFTSYTYSPQYFVKIIADTNTIQCGDSIQLIANFNNAGSNINYNWTNIVEINDNSIFNPIVKPSNSQWITVEVEQNGSYYYDSVFINVLTDYDIDFYSTQTNLNTLPVLTEFHNTTNPFNSYNYLWDFGDGISQIINDSIAYHNYYTSGIYDISLVAIKKGSSCSDTLVKHSYIQWVNVTDPDLNNDKISVYPNPAKNKITIDNKLINKNLIIVLHSEDGKIINSFKLENDINKIDISKYNQGVYFYKILSETEVLEAGKLIKI